MTPSSLISGFIYYLHLALSIALVVNIVVLILLPLLTLYRYKNKYGTFKVIISLVILLVFNVVGSLILYFYLDTEHSQ